MEWKIGSITIVQRKKLKIHEDSGIVAYMVESLKCKLTTRLKETTLPPMVALGPTITDRLLDEAVVEFTPYRGCVEATKSSTEILRHEGDLGKVLNQIYLQLKVHIKVVLEQLLIEGQFVLQFQSVARDVEELKKGKSSVTMQ
ncbi:hypothetical protein M9H77_07560 [Catharanthus roseus]|uniref:Uncharacterized protein n=1 Tax=Catharanthus roseus TaxID=4058 RepID=A0ACC0BV89_CATRO|nr:hypothetical protein M9H77_07560 [Catharanthus roseus]